jgi:hypothetical protein
MRRSLIALFVRLLAVSTAAQETKIYVNSYATGGTGTSANPWTGWDTATPCASDKTFYFPAGTTATARRRDGRSRAFA